VFPWFPSWFRDAGCGAQAVDVFGGEDLAGDDARTATGRLQFGTSRGPVFVVAAVRAVRLHGGGPGG